MNTIISAVRFVFEEVRGSMDEPWDEEITNAVVEIFEAGYKTELTGDGFRIIPENSSKFAVEMKEFRSTVFVSARCDEGFPVRYSKMAFDQKRAKSVFDEAVDTLLAE